ncbi:hypothetical protein BJ166DRAFT_593224 [Pestalotiopsis sp. NC0098]|nr:hypothetical protein BJ166DRAFT_593224 [Pestalotiopsis sp. NC0098]
MSSGRDSGEGRLDASGDREVVYCHSCRDEWYRDLHGLVCPQCGSEATEIVTPDNDPREPEMPVHYGQHHHHAHGSDDDPDEEDIENHLMDGHPAFMGRRMIFREPEGPAYGNRGRTNPADANQIMSRFQEMLEGIGGSGGPRSPVGRSGPEQLFPPRTENTGSGGRIQYTQFSGPGFGGVTTYTFSTSNNGVTRTTMRSSSPLTGRGGMNQDDPFQAVFGNILGAMIPPPPGGARGRDADGNETAQPGAPGEGGQNEPAMHLLLQQLFSNFFNAGGAHGDAVYSQEALDRIITQLMEQNPQSNAPPPASEETIANLPRKKLDEQMLGPELKGECTICIDEMSLGEEAVVLPCKHWFHEECVVLWLKEHNTCPICRAPIEGSAAGQPDSAQNASGAGPSAAGASAPNPPTTPRPVAEQRRSNLRQRGSERLASIRDEATSADASGINWRNASSRRTSDSPPSANFQPANRRVRDGSPTGRRSSRSGSSSDQGSSGGGGGLFSRIRGSFTRDRNRQ